MKMHAQYVTGANGSIRPPYIYIYIYTQEFERLTCFASPSMFWSREPYKKSQYGISFSYVNATWGKTSLFFLVDFFMNKNALSCLQRERRKRPTSSLSAGRKADFFLDKRYSEAPLTPSLHANRSLQQENAPHWGKQIFPGKGHFENTSHPMRIKRRRRKSCHIYFPRENSMSGILRAISPPISPKALKILLANRTSPQESAPHQFSSRQLGIYGEEES